VKAYCQAYAETTVTMPYGTGMAVRSDLRRTVPGAMIMASAKPRIELDDHGHDRDEGRHQGTGLQKRPSVRIVM
jgi:hypothetical protein